MTNQDIRNTSTTNLKGTIQDFSVNAQVTDAPQPGNKESTWDFPNFATWYGYYNKIPELKKAIGVYGTWVTGQGYVTENPNDKVELDNIRGSGEDDFLSILWNMLIIKKVNGDSFAEIIRDPKTLNLVNLKPLSPENITVVFNRKGMITRYEDKRNKQKFKPNEILHLVNDRVADNMHGDSVVEAMKWLIDARQEAMEDWRRISHRSSIRVVYVEEDNPTKLAVVKTQYQEAIENGEVMVLPGKRTENEFQDLVLPPVEAFLAWIRYLENAFYKAVGTPKTLAGDAEGIPESGGKMVVLTHEPTYLREVTTLEKDILLQLGITIKFNRQTSLADNTKETDDKNKNQTQAAQPADTNAGGI